MMEPPDFEAMLSESRKARQEDMALIESMTRLSNNADFKIYLEKIICHRIEGFAQMLLSPSGGLDGMVRSEYLKGAMFAFCLARDLPTIIMQSISDMNPPRQESDNG